MRPYSCEVYTAAKREWMVARAAGQSRMRISAVRFTHVVDNSIVRERLNGWALRAARLHYPGTVFYARSAREAAQLMLCAGLAATA